MSISSSLDKIPLFKGLSQAELEGVRSCLKEKSFDKGEVLFNEGKACERVFIVREGRVKLLRIASTGREQVLETLGAGDTCACNPGAAVWYCSSTAEALTPCKVWYLSRENYIRMVQTNSRVSQALNRLFAERLKCFSSLIEEVSLKDVKKRLVKFLLDMHGERESKYGKGDAVFLPFTREEIAQRIGAVRETIVRYLMQLKRAKLIDLKPHQIVIRDKPGLERLL
ncbi:MAG: Crp/Fnr family transcriptional regulator [Candidatus Omnitrophica bacterium]|nr:Crp/Fnr family transcriptional regulator [Candidatus Omnitrophota bacterium]